MDLDVAKLESELQGIYQERQAVRPCFCNLLAMSSEAPQASFDRRSDHGHL